MIITIEFLKNTKFYDEEKEIQTKVIDALYEDYLKFVKEEKDFWVDVYMDNLKSMPQYANLKPKMLKFTATKVWRGINLKNIRNIFPLEVVYGSYDIIEYNEEDKKVVIQRKVDDEDCALEEGTCNTK